MLLILLYRFISGKPGINSSSRGGTIMLTIKMLPALGGDCIVIKIHRDNVHQIIIVDSGMCSGIAKL